jgi:hypothetical protein
MKNTKKMMSLFHIVTGVNRDWRSSMKSSNRTLSLALFSLLALTAAKPSQAQQRTTPTYPSPRPSYTPPAPRPAPQPQYHPAPPQQPQTHSAPQPQYHPAPPQQTHSAAQPQYHPAPRDHSQPAPQPQPRTSAPVQPQTQSREQARQQQEQPRQQQNQQKEQASQQKDQQKQQKEQARQQKEQQKQLQKQQKEQQKEQAREQKELLKQQKNNKSTASAPKESASGTGSGKSLSRPAVLTPSQSQATIQRLNSSRSSMNGINRRPLPSGEMTLHSNGRMTLTAAGGRQYGVRPNGTIASYSDREKAVSFDKRGKTSSIHTANLDVHHGPQGQRTIIGRRGDGSKVVSTGSHSGYVERSVVLNNKTYILRTTIVNQRAYASTFVAYHHGSLVLAGFVPPVFFAPRFYGWAYYPWVAPIRFRWGWFGAPWYVGPNPYFVASPLYPSASFWLTDYMIGETLATAYQLHNDADRFDEDGGAADSPDANMFAEDDSDPSSGRQQTIQADVTTPITPEIKAAIAEEVKQQLAKDNAVGADPSQASFDVLPAALRNANHVFVVSNDLDVTTTDQQLCTLQAGDMLQLPSAAADDSSFVQLRVASSKRADCPAGILVSVSLPDIQEMQNNFQAQVESGLGELRNGQGQAGMPGAPADAVAAPPRPSVAGLTSVSSADSLAMLNQQRQQADQAEAQAAAPAF